MQSNTIKGKILKISSLILILYAVGLMVMVGGIFPDRYMELQKQLNIDILTNVNNCLSTELETIYREYENLISDQEVIRAFEDSGAYLDASKAHQEYRYIKYLNAKKFLREKNEKVLFLAANSISDILYIERR